MISTNTSNIEEVYFMKNESYHLRSMPSAQTHVEFAWKKVVSIIGQLMWCLIRPTANTSTTKSKHLVSGVYAYIKM